MPAWNEEASVGNVARELGEAGWDVLVVDDGSTDATGHAAREAGARVVRLPINVGVGGALRCGFRYAVAHGYTEVVQCDADGQHPPSEIAALLESRRRTGAHLLIGSRFAGSARDPFPIGRLRRATMRLLARSASAAAGTTITDATSGFRVIAEPLLGAFAAEFPDSYLGDTYEAVVSAGRAGYLVREVPVTMSERRHGSSSASPIAAAQFTLRAVTVVATRLHFQIPPCSTSR